MSRLVIVFLTIVGYPFAPIQVLYFLGIVYGAGKGIRSFIFPPADVFSFRVDARVDFRVQMARGIRVSSW